MGLSKSEKPKAAVYCRLSEEDRDKQSRGEDSRSIQNQKTLLIQYALEQGWDVCGIYSDDDYAGADRNRPEFKRLIEDARAHRFDIVLCKTQSRFTRELELVEKYLHGLFPIWNIRFVSVVDNADTANRGNKKARQINGLVNEWYLEDMSENIKSVLDSRRQNGSHIGSFALYGYEKDPERRGHLIVDQEAAAVVREVFTLFSEGYGKTAIARILNERGIPNPTAYKQRKGLRYRQPQGRGGSLWKYPAISHMLTNEIYLGNMVQGRYGSISYKTKKNRPRPREQWYVVEGTHEPIIDRELWERVQKILARRAKPFKGGTVGLFAGMTRCAGCGYALRSSKSHGKEYLQCSSRYVCRDSCEGAFISVEGLEAAVRGELNRLTTELADTEKLLREFSRVRVREDGGTAGIEGAVSGFPSCGAGARERKALERARNSRLREAEEYGKMLHRLYPDLRRGLITEQEYLNYREEFTEKQKELEEKASAAELQLTRLSPKESSFDGTKKDKGRKDEDNGGAGEETEGLHRLKREVVEAMTDHIVIGKKDPETGEIPVEIYWNF